MKPTAQIMHAIESLPGNARLSIAEIAELFGEKLNRVRAHFNTYRATIMRPAPNGSTSVKRLYDPPTIKAYLLFRVMRSELSYPGPRAEEVLQFFDVDLLWERQSEGVPQLSSFILNNMRNGNGAHNHGG